MFRRQKRREGLQAIAQRAAGRRHEVQALRADVQRLEVALRNVIAASDDLLVDLRRAQRERAQLASRVAPGFADAWFTSEAAHRELDDFFAIGEVDKRARRWLLSPN